MMMMMMMMMMSSIKGDDVQGTLNMTRLLGDISDVILSKKLKDYETHGLQTVLARRAPNAS